MRPTAMENVKWLVGTLALPVTLLIVTQLVSGLREREQQADTRLRLYTELLSKREEADTSLRKGVFDKVLETYLQPASKDLDTRLVALELLALNFHDSVNFSPLFWQIDREIDRLAPAARRPELRAQLNRIAEEVKARQVETLISVQEDNAGLVMLNFAQPMTAPQPMALRFQFTDPVTHQAIVKSRLIHLQAMQHDPVGRRVYVAIDWSDEKGQRPAQPKTFWIDAFDFPMVNHTRLSKTERIALILQRYGSEGAQLRVVHYPSSQMGEKDRPYLNDVISDLLQKN